MLYELKEIKEKLNQLILEVERLESSVHGEELIIEKLDFKYIKQIGKMNSYRYVFEYLDGVFFELPNTPGSSNSYHYHFSIFKGLLSRDLDRLVLIKREKEYSHNGFLITHEVEDSLNAKLRKNYRDETLKT